MLELENVEVFYGAIQALRGISLHVDEGEIVTSVTFPIPEASHYEKFVQPASRFALVGVFVAKYAVSEIRCSRVSRVAAR